MVVGLEPLPSVCIAGYPCNYANPPECSVAIVNNSLRDSKQLARGYRMDWQMIVSFTPY